MKRKQLAYSFLADKEQLKYVLVNAEERPLPRVLARSQEVPAGSGKVVILTGIRRSGKRLENAVFHHLRRRCRELFYLANGQEVDLSEAEEQPGHAWNVAWSLNDFATRERETAALDWARRCYPGLATGLVCHEMPEDWTGANPPIPAWKFLCDVKVPSSDGKKPKRSTIL